MLRKIMAVLRAAISAMVRTLERGWDGAWRWVMSPVRAMLGPAPPEPVDYQDMDVERRLDGLIEDAEAAVPTLSQAEAAAGHAAVEAVQEDGPNLPEPSVQERWVVRRARAWMEERERQRARGESIRAAMLASDLSGLDEAEARVLADLDEHDWESLIREEDGLHIAREVDDLVRGYACTAALHDRLGREGKLDNPPAPSPGM